MKRLSPAFSAHVNSEATSICNCWLIVRADGVRMGFTDHDRVIEFEGDVYESSSGFEASQMEESVGLTPDNHEVVGALSSEAITEEDIRARRYDGARIHHYVVNWNVPDEHILMQSLFFGEITRQDGAFKTELNSLVATLDQTNLRRFEKRCNADLGDKKCGVTLDDAYQVDATVSKIIAPDIFEVTGLNDFGDGWFSQGKAEFLSGDNAGSIFEIATHVHDERLDADATVTLWSQPPFTLQAGDLVRLQAGCDKQIATCRSKFDNALNFRGFPFMPGSEFVASYASNSENMDGGPIVP